MASTTVDIQLGGVLAGVTITSSNAITGVVSLGTDVTDFTGVRNTFVGTDAGKLAKTVNQAVFLGFNAGTVGLGDSSVIIGSDAAPLAIPTEDSGNSIVIGYNVVPNSTRVDKSTVIGRSSATGCPIVKSAVIIGDSVTMNIASCEEVIAIGSRMRINEPAQRITAVGHFSRVGGSNTVCVGYNNTVADGTLNNIALGTLIVAKGNDNVAVGYDINIDSSAASGNLIVGGSGTVLGAVSNLTSFDAVSYPGGLVSSNTLYLGGCLRWNKVSGDLLLRAVGTAGLVVRTAAAAADVSVITATPTLLTLYGNVTVTPSGVVTAPVVNTPLFTATAMTAGTLTASGLVTAQSGITVSAGTLSAKATEVTTLTASGLVTAQAGLTVSSGTLTANGGVSTTTVTASGNVSSGGSVSASGSVTAGGSMTASGSMTAGTTFTATGLVTCGRLTIVDPPVDPLAFPLTYPPGYALNTTSLNATGTSALQAVTTTTLTASGKVTANAALQVNGGLLEATSGLTVSTGSTTVQALTVNGLSTVGVINASGKLTVTSSDGIQTPNLTVDTSASVYKISTTTTDSAIFALDAGRSQVKSLVTTDTTTGEFALDAGFARVKTLKTTETATGVYALDAGKTRVTTLSTTDASVAAGTYSLDVGSSRVESLVTTSTAGYALDAGRSRVSELTSTGDVGVTGLINVVTTAADTFAFGTDVNGAPVKSGTAAVVANSADLNKLYAGEMLTGSLQTTGKVTVTDADGVETTKLVTTFTSANTALYALDAGRSMVTYLKSTGDVVVDGIVDVNGTGDLTFGTDVNGAATKTGTAAVVAESADFDKLYAGDLLAGSLTTNGAVTVTATDGIVTSKLSTTSRPSGSSAYVLDVGDARVDSLMSLGNVTIEGSISLTTTADTLAFVNTLGGPVLDEKTGTAVIVANSGDFAKLYAGDMLTASLTSSGKVTVTHADGVDTKKLITSNSPSTLGTYELLAGNTLVNELTTAGDVSVGGYVTFPVAFVPTFDFTLDIDGVITAKAGDAAIVAVSADVEKLYAGTLYTDSVTSTGKVTVTAADGVVSSKFSTPARPTASATYELDVGDSRVDSLMSIGDVTIEGSLSVTTTADTLAFVNTLGGPVLDEKTGTAAVVANSGDFAKLYAGDMLTASLTSSGKVTVTHADGIDTKKLTTANSPALAGTFDLLAGDSLVKTLRTDGDVTFNGYVSFAAGFTPTYDFPVGGAKTGVAAISAHSIDVMAYLYADAIRTSGVSAGSGTIQGGTLIGNTLTLKKDAGSSWDVAAGSSPSPNTLSIQSTATNIIVTDAFTTPDEPTKAYCKTDGNTGIQVGSIVSATGTFSTYVGTVTPDTTGAVPIVGLTTFAEKNACVGVVSAIEGSGGFREYMNGSLVFRMPRAIADSRAVVSTAGFGKILVIEDAVVTIGDLLCVSATTPGVADVQGDDTVYSWTVAKATETVTVPSGTGSVLVACKFLC
jgi:fibronectin-binding autotransporter adhesin